MFLWLPITFDPTDGHGNVTYDIGYGGAFYALVDIHQFKLDLLQTDIQTLIQLANTISQTVRKQNTLSHPDSEDLAFLYGTILTDGCDDSESTDNICVFADKEVSECCVTVS